MSKLTLKHWNKTYRWKWHKWGWTRITEIYMNHPCINVLFSDGEDEWNTLHTPEQLVSLGYMKELEDKNELDFGKCSKCSAPFSLWDSCWIGTTWILRKCHKCGQKHATGLIPQSVLDDPDIISIETDNNWFQIGIGDKNEKPELDINHLFDLRVNLDETQESAKRIAELPESWRDPVERIARKEAINLSNEIDKPIVHLIREEIQKIQEEAPFDAWTGHTCTRLFHFIDNLEKPVEEKPVYYVRKSFHKDIWMEWFEFCPTPQDPSILDQLRSALMEEAMQYEDSEPCFARKMLDLMDSLSDKQGEKIVSNGNASALPLEIKWFPQPWELIEVSNDGEKWLEQPLVFKWMNRRGQYETWDHFEGKENRMFFSFWKYARPLQPETTSLPELPNFDYEKLEENIRDVEFEKLDECRHMMWHLGKQVELLTRHLKARDNK